MAALKDMDDTGCAYNLYNRFVEVMMVVGIDENTGLVPADKDAKQDSDSLLLNLFHQDYEPQVIAAVSSSKATHFQPFLKEDPNYPPVTCGSTGNSLDGSGEHLSLPSRSKSVREDRTRRFSPTNTPLLKRHFRRTHTVNYRSVTMTNLPLSEEVIRSVPVFCFPENAKVYRHKPEKSVHFLVFTDLSGNKTFATCLTFYKPYILEKEDSENLKMSLETKKTCLSNSKTRAYLPQCCILISKYPYFYSMKECLSCMVDNIERETEGMFTYMKEFTYILTLTPVPPPGNVCVILTLPVFQMQMILYPSDWADMPVIDIPLYLVFLAFSIDNIFKIFTSILTEERVVFVSSRYGLLAVIMESFLNFILPFSWRFTYVPILSVSSLELLEAPGTFMMGCNSKHLEVVDQVEGLVVVNIDEGTVKINPEPSDNGGVEKTIPDVPVEPAQLFRKFAKGLRYQTDLNDVQRPFSYNLNEERKYRSRKMHQLNREITLAFLELMVNLFRGVIPELKLDLCKFNVEAFKETVAEADKPFYDKVLQTDMFKNFLSERLKEKQDFWSDYEAKTRSHFKKVGGLLDSSTNMATRKKLLRKQVSISIYQSSDLEKEYQTFRLPVLTSDALSFLRASIVYLSKTLEECRDLEPRGCYLYFRGMLQAAQGNPQSAVDDFLSLHSINARLVPTQYLRQLLNGISKTEQAALHKRRGSFLLDELCFPMDEDSLSRDSKRVVYHGSVSLPDKDVVLDEFVDAISMLEIANDYDTIQRLFFSLCTSENAVPVVDQKTLESFVDCHRENQIQCDSLKIRNSKLHQDEYVLKVSGLIKTDFGTGRIALTEKRLFFLKDVSNRYKEIIKLRDINKLEKSQLHTFLNKVDTLIIQTRDGSFKFTACLKDERNCWYMLIEEMRAGKVVAEATRDLTAIQQGTINVMLIDAVIRSGNEAGSAHEETVTSSAENLCHFTRYTSEGRHNLPKDTVEALQHRVDPNIGDRDRKTVEALLYTPGTDSLHRSEQLPPRLWCGMGDGKVKVFDATTWEVEGKIVQTKNTAACLVPVGETQVWVGSQGIFIIDTETIMCNKTLSIHQDLVTDIVISEDKRHAHSASVCGLIVIWEIQTLTLLKKFQLNNITSLRSLKIIGDQLWCGTWKRIVVLNQNGEELDSFRVQSSDGHGRNVDLDCFAITDQEVWAGVRREGMLVVWDRHTGSQSTTIRLECRGISTLLLCDNKIWVGTKAGTVYIYLTNTHQLWKSLRAHDDAVRSLCLADIRYVMSGGGSKDGKVAIWTPSVLELSDSYADNL
ncbi:DENN domain-containing protein 3-like [Haliotis cracherodii]|uniref:DENN domain-containing protein 3-like n=1 Tax=Haliotis cracherodii TaxID=6455 RepID=UPI0039ED6B72